MELEMATWANKYALLIITGIITFLAPIHDTLFFVGMISVADFITGIMKSHKAQKISSRKMINKVYAVVGYFIGIIIAHTLEGYFGNAIPMVKAVVAIIALTEIQSVRENIKEISGTDILSPLVKFLERKQDVGSN